MFRFLAISGCLGALFGGISIGQIQARAQPHRGDNSTSTYYGQSYLIPTYMNPCHSATFNDHGQSVHLCVDNFGRPIPVRNDSVASVHSSRAVGRAPASIGSR
jgi:hypothetical protein